MTTEAVAAFFAALRGDQALAERLRGVATADEFDRLAAELGRERGLEFTATELRSAIDEAMSRIPAEVTEEELQGVAGGGMMSARCMTATCVGGGGAFDPGTGTVGTTTPFGLGILPASARASMCGP